MSEQNTNLTVAQLTEAITALDPKAVTKGLKKADLVALYDQLVAAEAKPAKAQGKKAAAPKEQEPGPTTLVEALTSKAAILVKIRANGTVRSLPYLAPGSKERTTAVDVDTRRQAGETVEAIAEAMNVSVATVRRCVTGLALAHEVESGKHDAAWKKGEKNVVVHRVTAKGAAA
ncbi:hypothetical protein [Nocardioides sp. MH1]|uniref:hypothetical protein n=1 Tax=Nocardioides sp. MH1 TaxID=3242490 RepID=UPI003520F5CD